MTTTARERAVRHAADRARQSLVDDLERALADSGISAGRLARESGVDSGYPSRILAGRTDPSLETWARLAIPLGLDLAARLYQNTGPMVRDRHAAPMLDLLLRAAHPRWTAFTEAAVHRPSRGWIDVLLHEARERIVVAGELQSELRRLEQLVRWQAQKAAALPSWDGWVHLGEAPAISRLLVVRRTRATRAIAADFAAQLRVAYPAHPDDALAAVTGTAPWPGPAILWATLDARGARFATGR
jgi:hypothetical protein